MIVYLCHPFRGSGAPDERERNKASIDLIARAVAALGHVPLSPIHNLAWSFDEIDEDRELATKICLELIGVSEELWMLGDWQKSEGCRKEREHAIAIRRRIRIFDREETRLILAFGASILARAEIQKGA